jgi:kynurenine formamidase
MELIDLSMGILPHWRWAIKQDYLQDRRKGDEFQTSVLTISMHAFSHVDTPLHILPEKITIDQVPLEQLTGPAAVLDLSFVGANQGITEEDLRRAGKHIQKGDMVLLKTGWDLKRDWKTREFWTEAPYVEEKAAAWLSEQDIRAVGFDFPQDYNIRLMPGRHPSVKELPTHKIILGKGIYLIEYLINLHSIHVDRVTLFALPLKVVGAEGAPARVVAMIP